MTTKIIIENDVLHNAVYELFATQRKFRNATEQNKPQKCILSIKGTCV